MTNHKIGCVIDYATNELICYWLYLDNYHDIEFQKEYDFICSIVYRQDR